MTTITAVTTPQKITILKHLANDRDPGFVATVTRLPQDQVDAIADEYGWPDLDKVRWAIDELTSADIVDFGNTHTVTPGSAPRSTSAPQTAATPQAARPAAAPPSALAQRPVTPTAPRVNDNERRPVATSANELIVAASRSPKKRTQALGVKVAGLLGDLARILREEQEQSEAAREAAALRERNAKRIAELEAELARLKGKTPRAAKPAAVRTNRLTKGEYPCDLCDRVLDTPQGKSTHQRRAHEGFNPKASRDTHAA